MYTNGTGGQFSQQVNRKYIILIFNQFYGYPCRFSLSNLYRKLKFADCTKICFGNKTGDKNSHEVSSAVLMASASGKGSREFVHKHKLVRALAARIHKVLAFPKA